MALQGGKIVWERCEVIPNVESILCSIKRIHEHVKRSKKCTMVDYGKNIHVRIV